MALRPHTWAGCTAPPRPRTYPRLSSITPRGPRATAGSSGTCHLRPPFCSRPPENRPGTPGLGTQSGPGPRRLSWLRKQQHPKGKREQHPGALPPGPAKKVAESRAAGGRWERGHHVPGAPAFRPEEDKAPSAGTACPSAATAASRLVAQCSCLLLSPRTGAHPEWPPLVVPTASQESHLATGPKTLPPRKWKLRLSGAKLGCGGTWRKSSKGRPPPPAAWSCSS